MPRRSEMTKVFAAISEAGSRGLTVVEVMKRTGLGRSTVRRHMDVLLDTDRISKRTLEPDEGRPGRPENIYFDPFRK